MNNYPRTPHPEGSRLPAAPDLLDDPAAAAGQRLLTYYDDATGERTDLTAAALGGWAARTAALLRDGCGLGMGPPACSA